MNRNYTIGDFMVELASVWSRLSEDGKDFLAQRIAGERFKEELKILAETPVQRG